MSFKTRSAGALRLGDFELNHAGTKYPAVGPVVARPEPGRAQPSPGRPPEALQKGICICRPNAGGGESVPWFGITLKVVFWCGYGRRIVAP